MEAFDILVIGGGPGGYSLAIAAARKGLKQRSLKRSIWAAPA